MKRRISAPVSKVSPFAASRQQRRRRYGARWCAGTFLPAATGFLIGSAARRRRHLDMLFELAPHLSMRVAPTFKGRSRASGAGIAGTLFRSWRGDLDAPCHGDLTACAALDTSKHHVER